MNIYQRLMEISHELGPVSRDLEIEKANGSRYAAVSECAVLDAIKPLEYKYRVYSYPVERKKTSETVRREWTDSFGNPCVTLLLVDHIEVRYRFVNVDNVRLVPLQV